MGVVIVAGALANKHRSGGAAWTRLSWVLGLIGLGFDTYFLEQINSANCVDDKDVRTSFDACAPLAYFSQVTQSFGLSGRSALILEDGDSTFGLTRQEIADVAGEADLLVNLSGHLTLRGFERIPVKAFIDLDPGFTQHWHDQGNAGARMKGHNLFFTIGENIGTFRCPVPTGGINWLHIRQPTILELWPVTNSTSSERFTTVGSWRGPYGPIDSGEKVLGTKVHEFRKFAALPKYVPASFEMAMDIYTGDVADRELLASYGWRIVDPKVVVSSPEDFRAYIQGSGAEFSAAQEVYVSTNCGWLSDRTSRYLASGKPALVQDTGLRHLYPTGEGLITFSTLDEAITGAEKILSDYERHSNAARKIAEEYLSSYRVLTSLLELAGTSA